MTLTEAREAVAALTTEPWDEEAFYGLVEEIGTSLYDLGFMAQEDVWVDLMRYRQANDPQFDHVLWGVH